MPRPTPDEYGSFFSRYVNYPEGDDAREILSTSLEPLKNFLQSIPEDKAGHAYAEGKWTIRQLLQHIIDAERIFAYRALCIGRGEQQNLPGFEEESFAANAIAENRQLSDLSDEMLRVRETTILLYKYMDDESLARKGTASGHSITPNALAFITVGHVLHHQQIIKERYL